MFDPMEFGIGCIYLLVRTRHVHRYLEGRPVGLQIYFAQWELNGHIDTLLGELDIR